MKLVKPSAGALFVGMASLHLACGATPRDEATAESTATVGAAGASVATLTFSADWTELVSGSLVAGQPIDVVYDAARLVPQCGGTAASAGANGGGGFAWTISGYYIIGGTAPIQFSLGNGSGVLTPSLAGDLQIWFTCGNTDGNQGVDSNYGQNYHFSVAPSADAGADGAIASGTVVFQTSYPAGYGNAIYVTGSSSGLGSWRTAYKASYNLGSWTYQATDVAVGTQYKLILAPWVDAAAISVTSAGVEWQNGQNEVVPTGPPSVVEVNPSF